MKRPPRHPATIERNTPAPNDRGEFGDNWVTLATVMLDLHQLAGREREAAMQVQSETTWRAYMRFTPGLTIRTTDRVKCQGHIFDIIAVIDLDQHHQVLQLDLKDHNPA